LENNADIDLSIIIQQLDTKQINEINEELNFIVSSLSVRSYNALNNFLKNDISIITYYENVLSIEKFNFKLIRNIGIKSLQELEALNNKIIVIIIKYKDEINYNGQLIRKKKKDEIEIIIDNLNDEEKSLLNKFIKIKIEKLSNRGFNAITKYLNKNYSIKNYYECILKDKSFSFYNIRNIGVITVKELVAINNEIINYLKSVNNNIYNKGIEYCKLAAMAEFNVSDRDLDEIRRHSNNKIPIFKIIEFLLNRKYILKKVELDVFNNRFNLKKDQSELSLEEISKKVNLSRERIRQIQCNLIKDFNKKFKFVSQLSISHVNIYNINISADLIYISYRLSEEISKNENVSFSYLFYEKIFSIFLKNTHDIIEIDYIKRAKFSHNYLIKKELTKSFDFVSFLNEIYNGLMEIIKRTYEINLKEFISCFRKDKRNFEI